MADLVSYTIPNWDQYNPRNDRKNYKWFRFQNDFFIDPKIFGLTAEGKLLYQYLLCEASKRGDGAGVVNLELAASLTRINIKKIRDLLAEMVETKLIDGSLPSSCRRKDADGIATYETNERTNERGHHGVTPRDLERVYFLYPRKQGKTNGLKKIAKEINTPELLEQFETAVKNYAAHCETGITSKKYIKHFDTFCNCWRDYLDFKPERDEPRARAAALRSAASTGLLDGLNELEKTEVSRAGGVVHIGQRMNDFEFGQWLKNIGAC